MKEVFIASGVILLLSYCHRTLGVVSVNGGWSAWSQWGQCTSPYDVRIRQRYCSHPHPQGLGEDCIGRHTETSPCSDIIPTTILGQWSAWGAWGACSVTCSDGIRQRTRMCSNAPSVTCQSCIPTCPDEAIQSIPCSTPCPVKYRDCSDVLLENRNAPSGEYTINLPISLTPVHVYCVMPEGRMIIQRHVKATVSFDRDFPSYKDGFGIPTDDFWLGLDALHELTTSKPRSLYITFNTTLSSHPVRDTYTHFSVGVAPGYALTVTAANLTQTDGLVANNGRSFSAGDNDQDNLAIQNCAKDFQAGWWYNNCGRNNLNGPLGSSTHSALYFLHGTLYQVTASLMEIK